MSDSPTDARPTTRSVFQVPEIDQLDVPPAIGWVIHEVARSRESQPHVWAWCRVTDAGPGYDAVVYTEDDGVTHANPGSNARLGNVLFKVFC